MYSNDGLSRNYGTTQAPNYPEAAYGFQRFEAYPGRTHLVGFDRLNPQLQEEVISLKRRWDDDDRAKAARTYAKGKPAAKGARNISARPWNK